MSAGGQYCLEETGLLDFAHVTLSVTCRAVAQLVARLVWDQEAASSSLAGPTMGSLTKN